MIWMMPEKILSPAALTAALDARRARGERVVFTNGCFDLLHVGHIRYLQHARTLGDCLVVGLNSDDSVRGIKPNGRPIVPQSVWWRPGAAGFSRSPLFPASRQRRSLNG